MIDYNCQKVPGTKLDPQPFYEYQPIKGFQKVLAVWNDGELIGFVMCEDLGFEDVKSWIDSTGWKTGKIRTKKNKELLVRNLNTGEIVSRIDVSGKSPEQIERVMRGMLINMDKQRFVIDDSGC